MELEDELMSKLTCVKTKFASPSPSRNKHQSHLDKISLPSLGSSLVKNPLRDTQTEMSSKNSSFGALTPLPATPESPKKLKHVSLKENLNFESAKKVKRNQ